MLVSCGAMAATRQVGPTRTYKTPSAAIAAAVAGDIIEIDAGVYLNDFAYIGKNNLTLRGVGGRAHLKHDGVTPIPNGKGIWVAAGSNITVENMEFSGAKVDSNNGTGIRIEGPNLVVRNSYFHDNQVGILGGVGNVTIEYSEFDKNGTTPYGHNVYIIVPDPANPPRLTFRFNYTHRALGGHNLKSRAPWNYIAYNRITDEADGTNSYSIDLPRGGQAMIIGNLLQQSQNAANVGNSVLAAFCSETPEANETPFTTQEVHFVNNTFVNDASLGTFARVDASCSPGGRAPTERWINNVFVGTADVRPGATAANGNVVNPNPGLVNRAGFDYRLAANSPAINKGVAPGAASDGTSLTPTFHYLHPLGSEARPVNGALDAGAYETGGTTPPPLDPLADNDGDGIPNGVEVAQGTNPLVKDNDVFANVRLFVMQQYRDFMEREATAAEITAGVNAITGGQTRAAFVETLIRSTPYQDLAGPIIRLYTAYFLRVPEMSGHDFWVQEYIKQNPWTFIGISNYFVISAEFKQRYGALTNEQFVTLIYRNILGRDPDPTGFSFWTAELNSGRRNAGQVMADFSESPENKTTSQPVVQVTALYLNMMRQEVDLATLNTWTPTIRASGSIQPLVNTLIGSAAYRARFLP